MSALHREWVNTQAARTAPVDAEAHEWVQAQANELLGRIAVVFAKFNAEAA